MHWLWHILTSFINEQARGRVNEATWPSLDVNLYVDTETAPLLDDWATDINGGFVSTI